MLDNEVNCLDGLKTHRLLMASTFYRRRRIENSVERRITKNLFLLTCLISFNCLAQTNGDFLFRIDFNPTDQQFYQEKKKSCNVYVRGGVYYMDIKKSDTLYNPSFLLPVDPDKDFIMGASLKSVSGNSAFGLYYGDEKYRLNAFMIYSSKSGYEIYEADEHTSGIVSGPDFTPFVKTNDYNALLVEKIGNTVYFFVNYKLVATIPFSPLKGRSYGLFIPGGQQIACNYFFVKQRRKSINLIENYGKFGNPEKFNVEKNNSYAETTPIISADGEALYYTTYEVRKGAAEFHTRVCKRDKNGNWEKSKLLSLPNGGKNVSVAAVSADKNQILLRSTFTFSSSYQGVNGWSNAKELPFKTPYHHSDLGIGLSASGDFKTLIMVLEEEDTYGVADLYVSFLKDSVWTTPLNLGKNINSFGDDVSPFLAPDNKTLYFASNGWPGYGYHDIFMSTRLDDSWTRWSEPKNLGPMINTPGADIYYNTSASGDEAYLARSSAEDKFCHLYRITQPETVAPEPVVLIQGKVLDSQTGQPLSATITYSLLGASKPLGSVHSNQHNGTFAISLPKGKRYVFSARKKGFISEQRSSSTLNLKEYKAEEVELLLTSFKKGGTVIMHNLFFANNQATLLPASESELSRLYFLLIENQSMKIEIGGHTQVNNLPEKFNYDLSLARAVAVRDYLLKKGIALERIITKGYGNSQPVEKTKRDEVSQAKNRRVEFKIMEN